MTATKTDRVTLRSLTDGDERLVTKLFGEKGACGGCWCMYWRVAKHGALWNSLKGNANREKFLTLVRDGKVHAIIALHGREPVGWCCYGPREDFPRLLNSRNLQRSTTARPWAIVCFYILPKWRARGLGTRLLAAATAAAFAAGAREIEGYPKRIKARTTLPGPFVWTGTESMFRVARYKKIRRKPGMPPLYFIAAN